MQCNITASIVAYQNDSAEITNAVNSFLNGIQEGTLYVIDNSPDDRLKKYLDHPRIEYTFNNKNIGFGAAHNIALRKALDQNSTYHIVLNPDIYFEHDVIEKITDFMEQHSNVGLAMPKILYPDGRIQHLCKLLPTPSTLFLRRFLSFIQPLITRRNHVYEMHFTGYNKIMDVPFLSGCFMFLRTDTLREVGLFDERIFLYAEDIDLTRRIHKRYRTIFFPDVTIYHRHERGSYKSVMAFLYHIMSTITYFNKWGWFTDTEREIINQQTLLKLSQ